MEARRGQIHKLVTIGATVLFMTTSVALAQMKESDVPETSVVPGEANVAATPQAKASSTPTSPSARRKTARAQRSPSLASAQRADVETGRALVKLTKDTPVRVEPIPGSKEIELAHAGKFIQVTGSTREYLQVSLKTGQTGYIEQSAVDLVKPNDKIFTLTADAAVLEKPNKWAKKVSEVHKGHDVHVTGIALNYVQIKMHSGLEGFIPIGALQ